MRETLNMWTRLLFCRKQSWHLLATQDPTAAARAQSSATAQSPNESSRVQKTMGLLVVSSLGTPIVIVVYSICRCWRRTSPCLACSLSRRGEHWQRCCTPRRRPLWCHTAAATAAVCSPYHLVSSNGGVKRLRECSVLASEQPGVASLGT